eukprot:5784722-Prymnesium_polylepis.1
MGGGVLWGPSVRVRRAAHRGGRGGAHRIVCLRGATRELHRVTVGAPATAVLQTVLATGYLAKDA